MKKSKVSLRAAAGSFLSGAALTAALVVPANLLDAYPDSFPNLTDAYDGYGFVYCFSCSIFDRGVDKPDDYNEERIDEILGMLDGAHPTSVGKTPNVIFLQLESFIDVNRLSGVRFVDGRGDPVDPTPYFTSLKETCGSGLLRVPTIGAGTANTEFEVITGMSHHDFGTGEYPYKSFLKKRACESLPFLLRERVLQRVLQLLLPS
jgi:phosphoglycerol transferase MdoB-like AlkP superfamily enzyme